MGSISSHECTNCDYSVTIAGKINVNMLAVTDTYTCTNCNELVDVLVGEYGIITPKANLPDDESGYYTCPNCTTGEFLKKWSKNKRPCPKCKTGRMENMGVYIMTD